MLLEARTLHDPEEKVGVLRQGKGWNHIRFLPWGEYPLSMARLLP